MKYCARLLKAAANILCAKLTDGRRRVVKKETTAADFLTVLFQRKRFSAEKLLAYGFQGKRKSMSIGGSCEKVVFG